MKVSAPFPRKSVLVVEDDHDTRVSLRESLEDSGYHVVSATNGLHALELLERISQPSVIVLDINMPLMNGSEFLDIMLKKEKLTRIPVIQISAAMTPRLQGTVKAFEKPLDFDHLVRAIDSCA